MFGRSQKFVDDYLKEKADTRAPEEVSPEDFIQIAVRAGWPLAEAQATARISKTLGSSVRVGDRLLTIATEKI